MSDGATRSMTSNWPGAQVRQAHRRVDDRRVDDLVEVDVGLVPVGRMALDDDPVLGDPLDELERARAHRLGAEVGALGLRRLRRDHHAGAIGERGQDRRERRREVELDRRRVDDVDARDRPQLAAPVRAGHRLVALDVELHRRRVELLAVVEDDVVAQLDRQRLAVGAPLVAGGELRHDLQLLVDVEQLVAERREDDAADEGARQRRIEDVGVLGQADAQGLRLRCERRQAERGDGEKTGNQAHRETSGQSMREKKGCAHDARPGPPRPPRRSATNASTRRSISSRWSRPTGSWRPGRQAMNGWRRSRLFS